MNTHTRRNQRHGNTPAPEQQQTPFFNLTHQSIQAKQEPFFQPKASAQPGDHNIQPAGAVPGKVVNTPTQATGGMVQAKPLKEGPIQRVVDKKEEKKPAIQKQNMPPKEKDKKLQAKEIPEEKEKLQKKELPDEKEKKIQTKELPMDDKKKKEG